VTSDKSSASQLHSTIIALKNEIDELKGENQRLKFVIVELEGNATHENDGKTEVKPNTDEEHRCSEERAVK
jgi:FtsZ-binding cell division protein ZapB